MADSHSSRNTIRPATHLTTRVYVLRPKRSLVAQSALAALVAMFVVTLGAGVAAITLWHAHRGGVSVQCETAPVDEDAQQNELARTRLALAQETAARMAVQKTADNASAEAARL
jgi:hypothetical protein